MHILHLLFILLTKLSESSRENIVPDLSQGNFSALARFKEVELFVKNVCGEHHRQAQQDLGPGSTQLIAYS